MVNGTINIDGEDRPVRDGKVSNFWLGGKKDQHSDEAIGQRDHREPG